MYKKAAQYLKDKIGFVPRVAIILGTGLGAVADCIENPVYVDYSDVPNFPVSTVSGHAGRFAAGTLSGCPVIIMCGRVHYYEGYSMQKLAMPIQTLGALGVEKLVITNASGGINESFSPADIVMICDHIKLCADSPLRGENPSELGERFFDMANAYDKDLRELVRNAASLAEVELKEGVYAYMAGPQFETPAEIKALSILGADLVGMSTVPEVITAAHMGLKTVAISCVTNMAAGMTNGGLNKPVIADAEKTGTERMTRLIKELLKAM